LVSKKFLFTEYSSRQTEVLEHSGEFIIEGNTIDKVYLSHSLIRTVETGDLLLFYRSKDVKELTTLGVVERVFATRDSNNIIKQIGKRSVYTIEEIRVMSEKPTLVILFRWHCHFPESIGIEDLKDMGIIKQAPQSITKIDHNEYLKILKRSNLDEHYIIH
jgi:predicted RNA-binding protein with PUA-like domain